MKLSAKLELRLLWQLLLFSKKFRFQRKKILQKILVATKNIVLLARLSNLLEKCVREKYILLRLSMCMCVSVVMKCVVKRHGAYVTWIDCFRWEKRPEDLAQDRFTHRYSSDIYIYDTFSMTTRQCLAVWSFSKSYYSLFNLKYKPGQGLFLQCGFSILLYYSSITLYIHDGWQNH